MNNFAPGQIGLAYWFPPRGGPTRVSRCRKTRNVIRSLRVLVALAGVCVLMGVGAAKSAQAHGINIWGNLGCQPGFVTVRAPSALQTNYSEKAWVTGLYQWTAAGWVGPYHYGTNGWGDIRYSWKYWNSADWFYDGYQNIGPHNVGYVYYPVPSGAYYAIENYAYDYYDGHWQVGFSIIEYNDPNSPAFYTHSYYCWA